MPGYEMTLFDPPAPMARVTLVNPANGKSITDVPMLLDTGADVTLIPQSCVEPLGLQIDSEASLEYVLVGFDGTQSHANVAEVHMAFHGMTFRGRYLLHERPVGVIGRNVLNLLHIDLDGPRLSWDVRGS